MNVFKGVGMLIDCGLLDVFNESTDILSDSMNRIVQRWCFSLEETKRRDEQNK